jgi:DNA-binding beta-propeller fold protein YncE
MTWLFPILLLMATPLALAQEKSDDAKSETEVKESAEPQKGDDDKEGSTEDDSVAKAEIVLEELNNPTGLAIQPETGTIFIADSGNHQIVKLVDGKAEAVITDFPSDVYGKGPMVNIGPLGLLFLDKNTLVVGGGGLPDGEEMLRVYELPEDGKPIKAEAMKSSFRLEENDDFKGEGNFYALAATPDAIYVTCNGDDTKGWVSRAKLKGNQIESFERYLATKEATDVDAPVGATISPDGYLVIGQMGEINVPGDSLITFYDPNSKEMLLNLETGLHDIAAIAYSPRGQMYVLDYAWADATQGGLFQIIEDDKSKTGMRTKKITSLNKPTAMVFDSTGALYVTVIGEAEDGNSKGQLLKIPAAAGL